MIAIQSFAPALVLVVVDRGSSRAETVVTPNDARQVAELLLSAADRADAGVLDTRARRVDDEQQLSLAGRILLATCPACKSPPGVQCRLGKTPHADRRTAAIAEGLVSP